MRSCVALVVLSVLIGCSGFPSTKPSATSPKSYIIGKELGDWIEIGSDLTRRVQLNAVQVSATLITEPSLRSHADKSATNSGGIELGLNVDQEVLKYVRSHTCFEISIESEKKELIGNATLTKYKFHGKQGKAVVRMSVQNSSPGTGSYWRGRSIWGPSLPSVYTVRTLICGSPVLDLSKTVHLVVEPPQGAGQEMSWIPEP